MKRTLKRMWKVREIVKRKRIAYPWRVVFSIYVVRFTLACAFCLILFARGSAWDSSSVLSVLCPSVAFAKMWCCWLILLDLAVVSAWRHYGFVIRPVLKHGPRSLTCMRVFELQTLGHREIDWMITHCVPHQQWLILRMINPRLSIYVGTRKMVNYACAGWSQGKLWWKSEAILTCKSFVWHEYRGERLIEPSSSWFPSKFPSG